MFKHAASRSRKFKIYARSAVAGGREAEMGLENDREILSCDAAKFNVQHEIPFCTLNLRRRASLKFRRKFKIYPARNLSLRDF